jgi:hypothetical protein
LIHGGEAIALADIEDEIDVPREYIGELSMVALAVRIRICTGFSLVVAVNPASLRRTCSVPVSLTLRESSFTAPP